MKDRIKSIRKAENMTLVTFSEKLGISESALRKLENGVNNPSEQTIRAICSEFNINRIWLETGTGEMFISRTDEEELTNAMADLFKEEPGFKHRLIAALLKLSPEEMELLEQIALKMVDTVKKEEADP